MTNDIDRDERAAFEAAFDSLPVDPATAAGEVPDSVSTVVSVRLRHEELVLVERAATEAGVPLSRYIRQAAVEAAKPIDLRAAMSRAEAIAHDARELADMLHPQRA